MRAQTMMNEQGSSTLKLSEFLYQSQISAPLSSESLPSLDQSTISSDDSVSLSSLSTFDEEAHKQAQLESPRSIFKSYWEKQGVDHRRRQRLGHVTNVALTEKVILGKSEKQPCLSLEKADEVRPSPPLPLSSPTRRSIFGNRCFSESSLAFNQAMTGVSGRSTNVRQTQSASSLGLKKPLASCLRQNRFSGAQRKDTSSSSSSDASVSFQPQVNVHYYENVCYENWAAKGWEKWFA